MITNFLIIFKKSPLLAFIKFEPTFLTGSLAVCLSAPVPTYRSGRQGDAGGRVGGKFRRARAFRRSEAEAGQFPSKWFRAKFRISHQQELSEFFKPDGEIASRLRRSAGARPARRDAAKSHGSPNETETFIRV